MIKELGDIICIVVVYDVTNQASFDNITKWLDEIDRYAGEHVNRLIVGNKADLEEKRVIPTDVAVQYAEELGVTFLEASAKNSKNVSEAFVQLAEEIKNRVGPPAGVEEGMEEFQIEVGEKIRKSERCC